MTSDEQRLLDPDRVAKRGFSTSFRGFDQDEVRTFLGDLAAALGSGRGDEREGLLPDLERVTGERDHLKSTVAELEAEVTELIDRVKRAEDRAEQSARAVAEVAAGPVVPAEVDEATLTLFLGQETVRVLDAARAAARDTIARAEADATARTTAADERVTATEEALRQKQAETESALALFRATTDADVSRQRAEVEETTAALRAAAQDEVLALREATAVEVAALRAQADKTSTEQRSAAQADASRMRLEAETDAAHVRNEAAADALAAQDSAREQARLMLTEAQSVREKVLADLVKRRRAGRQQLDQVKAARDRLARSLAVVRKDLDEAMSELVAAVPDARAAMEAVGRRVPESADARKAAALAVELDSARESGESLVDGTITVPDIDALFDRLRTGGDQAETEPAGHADAVAAVEEQEIVDAAPDTTSDDLAIDDVAEIDDDDIDGGALVDGEPEAAPASADVMARAARASVRASAPDDEPDETVEEALDEAPDDEPDDETDEAVEDVHEAGDSEDEVAAEQIDLPEAFLERDVAMTRFGPDLRRQLKRALADDQSAVLDGLRRVRNTVTISDLPPVVGVLSTYAAAFEGPLRAAGAQGAKVSGGRRPDKVLNELIDRVARSLAEPLRERIERSIERADGDKAEVLDPIRAQYRDTRATELPGIADDALAEAFALGVYHALKDGVSLSWVPDPRSEPGPDCFDNTLAGPIVKPAPFPTGHRTPLGGPGCRCLVLPA